MCKGNSYIFYFLCILGLLAFSLDPASAQKRNSKKNKKKVEVSKADTAQVAKIAPGKSPVVPFRDTIFFVYGNIGSFTAKQRAEAINERISKMEEDPFFAEDSMKLVDINGNINIMYKGDIIMSVDTLQASFLKTTRSELAQNYLDEIISSIQKRKDETSFKRVAIQVGYTILVIGIQGLIIWFIIKGTRRLKIFIWLKRGRHLKSLVGLIDANRQVYIVIFLLKILRFFIILFSLYWGLWALFKVFPATMGWADELWGYVVIPLRAIAKSIIEYMPKLFTILVIIVIFRYTQKFIKSLADRVAEGKIAIKGFYADWARPTYNIVSGILYIFMFVLIFPYLPKSQSPIFQGVSVFAGLLLSLGSTSVIGNLVAGLVITYMRPFKIGDRVKMDDCVGNVIEKTALVTRVKTSKNELITIPNSSVMNSKTINYSQSAREYGLILYTSVTIGYDIPWTRVHELLKEVANRTELLLKNPKPFIQQEALDEFYVSYQLNVYTREANRMPHIYSELKKHIQDVFGEAGVELLSPHYRVNKNIDEIPAAK